MKVLFIGGTGLISSACASLAVARGIDLFLLTRGSAGRFPVPEGAQVLCGDVHGPIDLLERLLRGREFDSVVDWIAYTPDHIERDLRLFAGRTRQFVFVSSASVYQKPPRRYVITEETPLDNPYWKYARDKIDCERRLARAREERGFPSTIVRPSLTYGLSQIPLCVSSWPHPWTAIDRMKRGGKMIVPGDGTSLWVVTWNEDFARGFVGLLGRGDAVGEAFHITSDEVLTWNDIWLATAAAAGVEANLVHVPSDLIVAHSPGRLGGLLGDKSHSMVFDNAKIKRFVPDFACEVPFAVGVRRAIEWHEADPSRRTIDEQSNREWDAILAAYARALPGG